MVPFPRTHSHGITIFGNQTYRQPPTLAEGLFTAIEVRSQPLRVTPMSASLGVFIGVCAISAATTSSADVLSENAVHTREVVLRLLDASKVATPYVQPAAWRMFTAFTVVWH